MSVSPTVLVACDDPILLDEVIRHLEETPHWRLVASARSAGELLHSVKQPDCVLVSASLAIELAEHPRAAHLTTEIVAFGRQETTTALRAALKLGARGFVQWPQQREQLRALVEREVVLPAPSATPSGDLHAVWAPKGGAGATVIAAHLAGAFARLGGRTILVDLDLDHADQTCVLGAESDTKTVGDLLRVADELSVATVQSVFWSHPLGFNAVLAPGHGTHVPEASEVRRLLHTIRGMADHVIVDLASGANPVAVAAMEDASSVQVVLTPDLLSLRRARDSLKALRAAGLQTQGMNVVLNQAGASDITAKEVDAVLGIKEVTRIRADLQIYRLVNRGQLSPLACKLLSPLARRLTDEAARHRFRPVQKEEQRLPQTMRPIPNHKAPWGISAPRGNVAAVPRPVRDPARAELRRNGPALRGRT